MASQKFSKYIYDGKQVVTGDSRWVKGEFRHQPSVDCCAHQGRFLEPAEFVLGDLV